MAADTGFGITITFASGFFAQIRNVDGPDMSREAINTSHAGTTGGYMTKILADLADGGTIDVDLIFDPDEDPPIDSAAEPVTIAYPNTATWAFSGGLTNFRPTAPYDDLMTATATLTVCGAITVTPAA